MTTLQPSLYLTAKTRRRRGSNEYGKTHTNRAQPGPARKASALFFMSTTGSSDYFAFIVLV